MVSTSRFQELWQAAQARSGSTLAIGLAPALDKLPAAVAKIDDPFLPLGKLIINTTADLTCAYVFHLSAYLAIGAAGIIALERTLAYVPSGILKVLHAPFASAEYVRAAFEEALGADAVTLSSPEFAAPYLAQAQHGAFVPHGAAIPPELAAQLGTYVQKPDGTGQLTLAALSLDWHFGATLYQTRTFAFEEKLRAAALALRAAQQKGG
ncbi:MAG: hypothetical protein CUN49_08235 [Candidatus Thermofonsia Clade 1 bacterium]|jgi:hypothetical protein|uniref:Uncharacterized protein n=1 Tax=Candidatus Thermofonsia Clade 1 bacterium TaxID=2364210 RepID=A0A2M8PEF4_9CHLR|nr:MAG: hypothetical protein CUN49_08235 [Candidatus Thermofonsia Clade 1 bacterium]RMF53809.1 MAG: hypothetical protein D6749_01240 [Chloroflexota bacterium]